MPTISKANIELTFGRAVIDMGGKFVTELFSKPPTHPNADFIFLDRNIICELKVLENDPNKSGSLDGKAQALFEQWMSQGETQIYGRVRVNSSQLPNDLQWELAKLHSESVKRVLKQANKQIKATKAVLGLNDAKGHVIIVNNAISTFDPQTFAFAAHQSLGTHYSSINGVSLVSANYGTSLNGLPSKLKFWIDYVRDQHLPLDSPYLAQFQETWGKCLADLEGQSIPFWRLPNNTNLEQFGPIARA